MEYKKHLLFLLLSILLIVVLIPGCKKGMEEQGQKIVDELIEEGMATPAPVAKETPTPTPKPTPEPTSTQDMRTGFHFSDEFINQFDSLWMGKNTGLDSFSDNYAVFCDNGLMEGANFITYRFVTDLTIEEIQQQYGMSLYDLVLEELSHSCKFVGETNENGDPLDVTLNIQESPDGNLAYVGFMPVSPIPLVDDILNEYWPANGIINENLTDDRIMYKGFGFDMSNEGSAIYKMWQLGPDLTNEVFNWYVDTYQDAPDYTRSEETPMVPRISFTYDIGGDGPAQQCEVWVDAFTEPGFIRVRFATDIEF